MHVLRVLSRISLRVCFFRRTAVACTVLLYRDATTELNTGLIGRVVCTAFVGGPRPSTMIVIVRLFCVILFLWGGGGHEGGVFVDHIYSVVARGCLTASVGFVLQASSSTDSTEHGVKVRTAGDGTGSRLR